LILLAVILVVTLVLLVTQWIRIELTALVLIAMLGLSGTLSPADALAGFSNPAMLTVAAMLVLSAGLERAGVVDYVGKAIARRASRGTTVLLLFLAVPTAVFSAFMNNTAIVALMIPVALTMARLRRLPASKLLLPISYLSILGGTCTLIGTSTNILVDSLYRQAGGPGFGMFEFSALGVVYLGVGGAYVVLFLPRLLPKRTSLAQLMGGHEASQFVTEVTVPAESGIVGRRLVDVFGGEGEIRVLELVRDEEVTLGPDPEITLAPADVLLIEGTARTIHEMIDQRKLVEGTAVSDAELVRISRVDLRIVEAVIAPNSHLMHRKVRNLALNRRFGIRVLAVRRLGRHHQYNLRDLRMHSGDVLLLQGEQAALHALQEDGDVHLIEGVERTLTFSRKAPLALAILVLVVGLAAAGAAPLVLLAFAGVGAMLLSGCRTRRARWTPRCCSCSWA
jgi:di/tricarboxylate transporter